MEALARTFFPRNENLNMDNGLEDRIPVEIDVGELSMRFSRLKARKSPGMDGIMGEMWRNVFLAVPRYREK